MKLNFLQKPEVSLHLTQDVIQSISLLQYNSQELMAYIEDMTIGNPLIEVEYNVESRNLSRTSSHFKKDDDENYIEKLNIPSQPTLYHFLHEQVIDLPIAENEKKLLHVLIEDINESGYLEFDCRDICRQLMVEDDEADKLIKTLQSMDPPGIGARSLSECFLLQMERDHRVESDFINILENHFEDFAYRKWNKISKETTISVERLKELLEQIQQLNPKPGAQWEYIESEYVMPDVILEHNGGHWKIILTEDSSFSITLNRENVNELKKIDDPGTIKYYKENIHQYYWVQKSIEQRKKTIRSMIESIIKKQEKYFLGQVKAPLPMTMGEIADTLHVHPSTISRAVKNKYIRTPIGLFSIKHLFSQQVQQVDQACSVESVKNTIKSTIDSEDKFHPYSDQKIADLLKQTGIVLSRRTVAKYRDQMQIPPATVRKEL